MPSKSRTRAQAAKDKAALKRLQKSGTYSGKIDLRKAPTRYQLQKIEKLRSAERAKRAARSKPEKPASGAKISRKKIEAKELDQLKAPKRLTTYALPFRRKGHDEPEWRRFTYTQLRKFMNEYKPDDPEEAAEWLSYAVEERWEFETAKEVSAMRKDVNVYFSGVRISEPKGEIKKTLKSKRRAKK